MIKVWSIQNILLGKYYYISDAVGSVLNRTEMSKNEPTFFLNQPIFCFHLFFFVFLLVF